MVIHSGLLWAAKLARDGQTDRRLQIYIPQLLLKDEKYLHGN